MTQIFIADYSYGCDFLIVVLFCCWPLDRYRIFDAVSPKNSESTLLDATDGRTHARTLRSRVTDKGYRIGTFRY